MCTFACSHEGEGAESDILAAMAPKSALALHLKGISKAAGKDKQAFTGADTQKCIVSYNCPPPNPGDSPVAMTLFSKCPLLGYI